MEKRSLAKAEHKAPHTISTETKPPSDSAADLQFFVSYGAIISCRLGEVPRIRGKIEAEGGRIIFQSVSNGPLILLRGGQVERVLQGDTSALAEVHRRKERRSVEK
jgi:hypothetical protein